MVAEQTLCPTFLSPAGKPSGGASGGRGHPGNNFAAEGNRAAAQYRIERRARRDEERAAAARDEESAEPQAGEQQHPGHAQPARKRPRESGEESSEPEWEDV